LVEPKDKEKDFFRSNRSVRTLNNRRKTSSIWKKRKGNLTLNALNIQSPPVPTNKPKKLNSYDELRLNSYNELRTPKMLKIIKEFKSQETEKI
jgi:hypothetical protein